MSLSAPQSFFLRTALFFGLIFIFLIPPFHVPDEPDHFKRAYHITEGFFSGQQQNNRLGGLLPTSIIEFTNLFKPLRFEPEKKVHKDLMQNAFQKKLSSHEKSFSDFPNTGLYPPTVYFPQILTLVALKTFKTRPLFLLYSCRVTSLFFWIAMILYSLKLIPYKKWLWCLLALLPASLFVNASASGDIVTNASAFVLIALFLRIIADEKTKVDKKILFQLFFFSTILSLNKFVYTPIIFLIFLVPIQKISKKISFSLVFWNTGIVLLWYLHSKNLFIPYDNYNTDFRNGITLNKGVNPLKQLAFIFQNPIVFFKTFMLSYVDTLPATSAHYFGKFGWGRNYIPDFMIALLAILTFFLSINKEEKAFNWTKINRFTLATIALIMTIGLSITIYMMWIKVGGTRIHSLSGRYYFAIMPLVWLALPPLISIKERKLIFAFKLIILMSLSSGVLSAFVRYY